MGSSVRAHVWLGTVGGRSRAASDEQRNPHQPRCRCKFGLQLRSCLTIHPFRTFWMADTGPPRHCLTLQTALTPLVLVLTIQPSGMAETGTTLQSASAANLSATTTSVGSTNSTPLACRGRKKWLKVFS